MVKKEFEVGGYIGLLQGLSATKDGSPVGADVSAAGLTNKPELAVDFMAPTQTAGISLSKPAFSPNTGPGGVA